eukprot:3905397-Rhodomonas_salina.2
MELRPLERQRGPADPATLPPSWRQCITGLSLRSGGLAGRQPRGVAVASETTHSWIYSCAEHRPHSHAAQEGQSRGSLAACRLALPQTVELSASRHETLDSERRHHQRACACDPGLLEHPFEAAAPWIRARIPA